GVGAGGYLDVECAGIESDLRVASGWRSGRTAAATEHERDGGILRTRGLHLHGVGGLQQRDLYLVAAGPLNRSGPWRLRMPEKERKRTVDLEFLIGGKRVNRVASREAEHFEAGRSA